MNLYKSIIYGFLKVKTMPAIFVISTLYAALRYNVFSNIPWKQFPLFTLNKSISFTGLIFLIISITIPSGKYQANGSGVSFSEFKKKYGIWGLILTIIHSIISFLLLNPGYYRKLYYESGQLTTSAYISITSGVAALFLLFYYQFLFTSVLRSKFRFSNNLSRAVILLIVIFLTAVHNVFIGYAGWINPQSWPGNMPPITLLSSIAIITCIIAIYLTKKAFN